MDDVQAPHGGMRRHDDASRVGGWPCPVFPALICRSVVRRIDASRAALRWSTARRCARDLCVRM